MAAVAYGEYELEALPELEQSMNGSELESEFEAELESELEGELESPEMFGWSDITRAARRGAGWLTAAGSPQRRAAIAAGKAAATGIPSLIGSRFGDTGKTFATIIGDGLSALIPDKEMYGEGILEFHELENELSPIRRIYPDAIMEHMAHEAQEAESEQEVAEGFLPLIPMLAAKALPLVAKVGAKLGAKLIPKIGNVISKVTPRLMRGVSNVARTLFRNRRTRPLVRTVPTIARRTLNTIARQTAAGRPVSPVTAQRILTQQTTRLLASPQQTAQVLRRANALDRQYHRITATPAAPSSVCRCSGAARPLIVPAPRPCCPRCGQLV